MSKELNILLGTSGLSTVIAVPYLVGVAQASIALTEIATSGRYVGDMTGVAGVYQIDFLSSGVPVGSGQIMWDGEAEIFFPTATVIAMTVWDEILTGTTHNIPTSAGRRLRESSGGVVWTGTAQGPGIGTNQIQLDADASSLSGSYDPSGIAIIDGTGIGQSRLILQYDGLTRTATVDKDWKVLPDATSDFIITTDSGREHVNEGLIRAATINTIQLNESASTHDDVYIGQIIFIRSGKGADQACKVLSYDGMTKTATLCKNLAEIPDTTSAYVMLPTGFFDGMKLAEVVANAVLDETA